jgi:hypothetical protein
MSKVSRMTLVNESGCVCGTVLGPTTDVACLLVHWPELAKAAVDAVVFLGSQPAGERWTTR